MLDTGDTAWVLVSAALVLFMTPGLAFFYGGMVRSRHVLGMLMQNIFAMGIISVLWTAIGYSLAFGGTNPIIGDLSHAFLSNTSGLSGSIPTLAFVAFQMMFAVITPALISGATADRLKFHGYALLIAFWAIIVYFPVARWVWNPSGWIYRLGALDFAGGAAIHINAGIAALVIVLVVGRRLGHNTEAMPPHNLPLTILGTGILWFGWIGFNAGSSLGANGVAAQAAVNTHVAAAAAMLGWLLIEHRKAGHATTLGGASGAVAGLVAITPCAGFVGASSALIIGGLAGVTCYAALRLKNRFNFDDALDVVAVHLIGGVLGTLLLGVFADSRVNEAGADGLFYGGGIELLWKQSVASAAVMSYSALATLIIAVLIHRTIGLRVEEKDEREGLDRSQHAESAYQA